MILECAARILKRRISSFAADETMHLVLNLGMTLWRCQRLAAIAPRFDSNVANLALPTSRSRYGTLKEPVRSRFAAKAERPLKGSRAPSYTRKRPI